MYTTIYILILLLSLFLLSLLLCVLYMYMYINYICIIIFTLMYIYAYTYSYSYMHMIVYFGHDVSQGFEMNKTRGSMTFLWSIHCPHRDVGPGVRYEEPMRQEGAPKRHVTTPRSFE